MERFYTLIACSLVAAAVASVIRDPASCSTGRLYIGNIDESHPQHVQYNGIYLKQPASLSGQPVYRHEARDLYLYYLSFTDSLASDQWVISSTLGNHKVALSYDVLGRHWRLWDSTTLILSHKFSSLCVDESFQTCSTGILYLSGVSSSRYPSQVGRMGEYRLTQKISSLRPVYQQVGGEGEYLFYRESVWFIGPDWNKSSGGMFNTDNAWRPEYIRESWVLYSGKFLNQEPSVNVKCLSDETGEKSIPVTLEGSSDAEENRMDEEPQISASEPAVNLRMTTSAQDLCKESQINLSDLEVVATTGNSWLDIVFLRCAGNQRLRGSPGVVCRVDGTWSGPPECERPPHLITPQEDPYRPQKSS